MLEGGGEVGVGGAGGAFLVCGHLEEVIAAFAGSGIIAVGAVGGTGAAGLTFLIEKRPLLTPTTPPIPIQYKRRLTLLTSAPAIAFSAIFHATLARSIVAVEIGVARAGLALPRVHVKYELVVAGAAFTFVVALFAVLTTGFARFGGGVEESGSFAGIADAIFQVEEG